MTTILIQDLHNLATEAIKTMTSSRSYQIISERQVQSDMRAFTGSHLEICSDSRESSYKDRKWSIISMLWRFILISLSLCCLFPFSLELSPPAHLPPKHPYKQLQKLACLPTIRTCIECECKSVGLLKKSWMAREWGDERDFSNSVEDCRGKMPAAWKIHHSKGADLQLYP